MDEVSEAVDQLSRGRPRVRSLLHAFRFLQFLVHRLIESNLVEFREPVAHTNAT